MSTRGAFAKPAACVSAVRVIVCGKEKAVRAGGEKALSLPGSESAADLYSASN